MVLSVISSSSKGNCYILDSGEEMLILEAGVPMQQIKKAIRWRLDKVAGCLVTHRHKDHSFAVRDVLASGIRLLTIEDVLSSAGCLGYPFSVIVEPNRGYAVGRFKIYVLQMAHDVPCVGYIITHPGMGRLLFATDTMMIDYALPRLDHIMVEANYEDSILRKNIADGVMPEAMKPRLMRSHMELGVLRDYLASENTETVRDIILLHLSSDNSDAGHFKDTIEGATGKPVIIARSGLEYEFS